MALKQDVATRSYVRRLRILDFIVAYAILARDEDHAGRRKPRHIDRIMSCAGHDQHVGADNRA
jgi:hypothetical protein